MSKSQQFTRRSFLASTTGAFAAPYILSSTALGRRPAIERINIGLIGAGKRGGTLLRKTLRFPQAQVVAVAECESRRREHRARMVEAYYSEQKKGDYKGCARYNDFRDLLERKDLDAVIIATPDHWHAIPVVEAAKRRLDVYCEKPLSLTIHEAKVMADTAKKYKIVFQTGSQQRTEFRGKFRRACELVRNGRIGKVKEVYCNVGAPAVPCTLPEQEVPEGTDWNLWLGPAPARGYHVDLCPYGVHNHFPAFRNYIDYSGGAMTDWGAHHFDIAQWGLGRDESGPVEVIPPNGNQKHLIFKYDDGVLLHHAGKCDGEAVNGTRFIGTDGVVEVNRSHFKTWPESIAQEEIGDNETRLYRADNHIQNWLECIRSRYDPVCTAEIGARSVTVCHLANLGYWNKRPLKWDPKKWEFPGDAEANSWRDRPKRDPWELIA